MESALLAFKRPLNGVGANNASPLREMHQESTVQKKVIRRKDRWTDSEELKLKDLVGLYGLDKWKIIAEKMQTRTSNSCRMRWYNELNPKTNQADFTEDEDEVILVAQRLFGNKWSKIAKLLEGRTNNDVKNRWRVLVTNRSFTRQLQSKLSNLAALVRQHPHKLLAAMDEFHNYRSNMLNEETTNLHAQYLQEENNSSRMPEQHSGHHHHFSTIFPADPLALFTPHVSIPQPPPPPPSAPFSLPSPGAADAMTRKTPKFFDFLGVGDS
ncbi:transcription factor MYB117 [Capsella rubella]|uniref:transcription factor MYB117 n=1 Tax=Capsella rubella TaxID=81985 RepID=UPI000CD53860|nr:transcription factor MYB117 [Capsella rubella]